MVARVGGVRSCLCRLPAGVSQRGRAPKVVIVEDLDEPDGVGALTADSSRSPAAPGARRLPRSGVPIRSSRRFGVLFLSFQLAVIYPPCTVPAGSLYIPIPKSLLGSFTGTSHAFFAQPAIEQ